VHKNPERVNWESKTYKQPSFENVDLALLYMQYRAIDSYSFPYEYGLVWLPVSLLYYTVLALSVLAAQQTIHIRLE
jgi:hypothetical protein